MNFKKFISGVSALTIAASAFAGMAVTANAASETSNWTLSEATYIASDDAETAKGATTLTQLQMRGGQFRDWNSGSDGTVKFTAPAYVSFYKFAIPSNLEGTVTKAEFTFTVTGTGDDKSINNIRALGYNPEWSASTLTYKNAPNNGGTIGGTVTDTGSYQPLNTTSSFSASTFPTPLTADATKYVKSAVEGEKSYVSLAVVPNHGRTAYLSTTATLNVTVEKSAVCTETFTANNGDVSPVITIYSDSERTTTVENGVLFEGQTYYFKAVADAYNDYYGQFTVDPSNLNVAFNMEAATVKTVPVNAYDENNEVIKTYSSIDTYVGKGYSFAPFAYIYDSDSKTYYKYSNINEDGSVDTVSGIAAADTELKLNYTKAENVVYYAEAEIGSKLGSHNNSYGGNSTKASGGVQAGAVYSEANGGWAINGININKSGIYKITVNTVGTVSGTRSCKLAVDNEESYGLLESKNGACAVNETTVNLSKGTHTFKYLYNNGTGCYIDYLAIEFVEDAPNANLETAAWTADAATGYEASGNVLTDTKGNSVYGYKATLDGNGYAYDTVKVFVTTLKGNTDTKTYDDTTFSADASGVVFYVISNVELNTDASRVYCE